MKYKVCLLNYRGHESGKNGRYAGKLCQKNLANWRSVLKERIGRDKCTVLLFGRKKEQHKHRVQALGRTMLFSSSWNLESQGSGHSLSDLCHCGKDSQNNRRIQNENCEASEVAVCSSLIAVLWTFLGTALKKRMNQLQTFKRATGIEIWKTSPTKTENNGVFIPKKWSIMRPTTKRLK